MTRLVLFDCDGTLVDSERLICASMQAAFASQGLVVPEAARVRTIVGLSLAEAIARLSPETEHEDIERLCDGYRAAFHDLRATGAHPELMFPGAREAIERLASAGWTLGIATGKSRRGLDSVLRAHELEGLFATLQTADEGPGKPHPAMVHRALAEIGAAPERTVLVGDTTYDITMALAANVGAVGVAWGYHPRDELAAAGAHAVLEVFDELEAWAERLTNRAASTAIS